MAVRVTGKQGGPCCDEGCRNSPVNTWTQTVSGSGVSFQALSATGVRLTAGNLAVATLQDAKTLLDPNRNFCFSFSAKADAGSDTASIGAFGFVSPGALTASSSYIRIERLQTTGWVVIWSNGVSATQKALIASDIGVLHTFKFCRLNGGVITVQVDGTPFKFSVDGNFPTGLLNPEAFVQGIAGSGSGLAQYDLFNFCLKSSAR